jgi:hypothetical protein
VYALLAVGLLAIALGALLWWGSGFRPTRPRPGSRYRGTTYLDVHKRLDEAEQKRQRRSR